MSNLSRFLKDNKLKKESKERIKEYLLMLAVCV